MSIFLTFLSVLLFALGTLLLGSIKSDIQIQIIATLWTGGTVTAGLASIARRLARIERMLQEQSSQALPRVNSAGAI